MPAIIKDKIPVDAISIWYQSGRRKGYYHFWKRVERTPDGDIVIVWFWSAMGDGGKQYDVDDAKQAAIQRIRDSR